MIIEWKPISTMPEGVPCLTKIDDSDGVRNETLLVKRSRGPEYRPMFWFADGSMYVYYTPTHWANAA